MIKETVDAFNLIRRALDTEEGNQEYEDVISEAENLFVAKRYVEMAELLKTIGIE